MSEQDSTSGTIRGEVRKKWFAMIYRPVTRCAELPDGAYRVYSFLKDMTTPGSDAPVVFPGQSWLAKEMKKRRQTINENIKILEAFGLVTIRKVANAHGFARNEYIVHDEVKRIPPEYAIEGETRKRRGKSGGGGSQSLTSERTPASLKTDVDDETGPPRGRELSVAEAASPPIGHSQEKRASGINLTLRRPDLITENQVDQINNNPTTEDSCCCGWAEPDLPPDVHERYHQAEARLRELYHLPPARRPTATTSGMLREMARTCTSAQLGTIFDAADGEKDRCAGRPPNQQYLRTTMQNVLAGTSPPTRQRDISREHPTPPGERPKSRWQADVITVQDIIAGRVTMPGSKVSEEGSSDEPAVSQQPVSGGEAANGLRRAEGRSISYRDIVSGRASPPQR